MKFMMVCVLILNTDPLPDLLYGATKDKGKSETDVISSSCLFENWPRFTFPQLSSINLLRSPLDSNQLKGNETCLNQADSHGIYGSSLTPPAVISHLSPMNAVSTPNCVTIQTGFMSTPIKRATIFISSITNNVDDMGILNKQMNVTVNFFINCFVLFINCCFFIIPFSY